jgi:hypothetical protein
MIVRGEWSNRLGSRAPYDSRGGAPQPISVPTFFAPWAIGVPPLENRTTTSLATPIGIKQGEKNVIQLPTLDFQSATPATGPLL